MTKLRLSKVKICLVCSSGGHLLKTWRLKPWWEKYDRFWITKDDDFSDSLLKKERIFCGYFPENRNLINFFRNLWLALKILRAEKPEIIFSTGAGVGVPFVWVGRLMGIRTIFMETFTFLPMATLSGRLVYPFVDLFLVQNKKLLKTYPKAKYWGKTI
jgi:beta-1,4-N-acetylglucosaminyltransferase